jgi:hypothetical protein
VSKKIGITGKWKIVSDKWIGDYIERDTRVPRQIHNQVIPFHIKLERELNHGLLVSDAEAVFSRMGQHAHEIFKVSLVRPRESTAKMMAEVSNKHLEGKP